MFKILVTGSIGFIGFHLCKKLLDEGHEYMELITSMIIMILILS